MSTSWRYRSIGLPLALAATVWLASACGSTTYGDETTTPTGAPRQTYDLVAVGSAASSSLADAAAILQDRLSQLGIDATARVVDDRIVIDVPADDLSRERVESLLRRGKLEFRPVHGEHPTDLNREDGLSLPQVLISPEACRVVEGADDHPSDQPMVAPLCSSDAEPEAVYELGASLLTGTAIESASAELSQQGEWTVQPVFRAGADGIDAFNDAASACFNRRESCPLSRLAITLDGRVVTAPNIQQDQFERDQILISGGFSEESARDLAAVLGSQALPVELRLAD